MEVVSTSNLISSENEKISHGHEFFCYASRFDERSNRQLCIYASMNQVWSFEMAELWKAP